MSSSGDTARRRASRSRMPSSAGYMFAAIVAAAVLFFILWWMLFTGGDEAPWISAGLAAGLVLLIALSAREVVMRRALTRYLLEHGAPEHSTRVGGEHSSGKKTYSATAQSAALRALQNQSAEADAGSRPELHFDMFKRCQSFVSSADEALRSNSLTAEKRSIFRAGQERARTLEKHHMLTWARESSLALTHEAQRRARVSDKIETAYRALDCLDTALQAYPTERELDASKSAIWEFIASVKVAHWVELAERAAFKGHYRRAINRYKDALFYLNRDTANDEIRVAGAERIGREIMSLRARLASSEAPPDNNGSGRSAEEKDVIN